MAFQVGDRVVLSTGTLVTVEAVWDTSFGELVDVAFDGGGGMKSLGAHRLKRATLEHKEGE